MSDQLHTHKAFLSELKAAFSTSLAQHLANASTKDLLDEIKSYVISLNSRSARIQSSEYRAQDNRIIGIDDATTTPLSNEIGVGEEDFHHLWFMVIELAKIIPTDGCDQDALVCLLLYFRELGTLAGQVGGRNTSRHGGAGIWIDLPYFAPALLDAWGKAEEFSDMARVNLAAFTGRCVALGVEGAEKPALWLLRKTLEVEYVDQLANGASLNLEHWISASVILLEHCVHHILSLCIHHGNSGSGDAQFLPATREQVESSDFKLESWLLWRKKFQELSGNENVVIAKNAKGGFEAMIGCGRELGFVVDGEGRYLERVYRELREELGRSGNTSVGVEDIITDPNWVG